MSARELRAELHVHLEGTVPPPLARTLAEREGVAIGDLLDGERYRWSGFSGFLRAYDRVAALLRRPEDYRDLAHAYLTGIAAEGALYCELTLSPDHARAAGLSPQAYVEAVAQGARAAESETGIVARATVVGVRHLGPAAVEEAACFAAAHRGAFVTGFGLAGDERAHRPADFARAFAIARGAGLGLTAHAGEFAGAEAVAETLDALAVTRLGHGVRAAEDAVLVERLAREAVTLECCPGSNLALGLYPTLAAHPLRKLMAAGLRLTLNSDDPPFFGTSLSREYAMAGELGLSPAERLAMTRNALEAAFVDEPTRARLLERLMMGAISLGASGASA